MDSPDGQHVSAPGLLVIDITAADEATAHAAMTLDRLWATSGPRPVRRNPGQAGVKARLYEDLSRRPDEDTYLQNVAQETRS
ncbi:DUF6207 family protein [Streptomyces sp. NPDC056987]|uniref:DUF6207 family protein n=1 Tax=Streptomyces sp. NPDC056987 TaxID=3345988 RepID=UPI00362CE793